jgi:hypothetical protein
MSYEIAIIPALAAIVYTLIDVTKTALGGDEKFKRFIPLIAMVLGAVCGVVAFYCVPGVMETENLLVAIILGASSGLSATGTNQVAKQLTKSDAKIMEICYENGFENFSYFIRKFKEYKGVTPKEYRRQQGGEGEAAEEL